jgi:hypothetical protein
VENSAPEKKRHCQTSLPDPDEYLEEMNHADQGVEIGIESV